MTAPTPTPEDLQERFNRIARYQRELVAACLSDGSKAERTSRVMLADDELRMALYYLKIDLIRLSVL